MEYFRGELIRRIREGKAQSYSLEFVEGATLESAHSKDKDERDWNAALKHYYSVFKNENASSIDRARAVTGMAQMLINTNNLTQARDWLAKGGDDLADVLQGKENTKFQAYALTKLAWIASSLGEPKEQRDLLINARSHLTHVPLEQLDEYDKKMFAEVSHFLGKAYYDLSAKSKNISAELYTAKHLFQESLGYYETLGDISAQAFNNLWLARCSLKEDDPDQAERYLDRSFELIQKDVELRPAARDQFANAYMVQGAINLHNHDVEMARRSFENAYEIRSENKPDYPKGKAEALAAMAGACWAQGDLGGTIRFGLEAAKNYLRTIR